MVDANTFSCYVFMSRRLRRWPELSLLDCSGGFCIKVAPNLGSLGFSSLLSQTNKPGLKPLSTGPSCGVVALGYSGCEIAIGLLLVWLRLKNRPLKTE